MQIKDIILYGENGKRRILTFRLGEVNIITGDSKTGKTALIDIIDYCFGSDDFKIAEGKVRDYVLWYAVRFQLKQGQLFIARPNPTKDLIPKSKPSIILLRGDIVEIPNLDELEPNITNDGLKYQLLSLIGIGEYIHKQENFSRQDTPVSFKHSRFYSFQPQTDIDQRDFLFYHQKKDLYTEQAIKDTLPYFLGAIKEDNIALERELADRRRNRNLT